MPESQPFGMATPVESERISWISPDGVEHDLTGFLVRRPRVQPQSVTEWGKPQRFESDWIALAKVSRDGPRGKATLVPLIGPAKHPVQDLINNPPLRLTPANRAERRQKRRKHRG